MFLLWILNTILPVLEKNLSYFLQIMKSNRKSSLFRNVTFSSFYSSPYPLFNKTLYQVPGIYKTVQSYIGTVLFITKYSEYSSIYSTLLVSLSLFSYLALFIAIHNIKRKLFYNIRTILQLIIVCYRWVKYARLSYSQRFI